MGLILGGVTDVGWGVSFRGDASVLELMVIAVHLCEDTKTP